MAKFSTGLYRRDGSSETIGMDTPAELLGGLVVSLRDPMQGSRDVNGGYGKEL